MKTPQDLEHYIGALLNNPSVEPEIIGEIENVKIILFAYMYGLLRNDFPTEKLVTGVKLEEIPEIMHTAVAQMSILKGKPNGYPEAKEYLWKNLEKLMKVLKETFIKP